MLSFYRAHLLLPRRYPVHASATTWKLSSELLAILCNNSAMRPISHQIVRDEREPERLAGVTLRSRNTGNVWLTYTWAWAMTRAVLRSEDPLDTLENALFVSDDKRDKNCTSIGAVWTSPKLLNHGIRAGSDDATRDRAGDEAIQGRYGFEFEARVAMALANNYMKKQTQLAQGKTLSFPV